MSCLVTMIADIAGSDVNVDAYDDFVEYTVDHLRPQNNIGAVAYINTLTSAVSYIVLVILLLILAVFVIIVFIFVIRGYITIAGGVAIVATAAALMSIYYMIAVVFAKSGFSNLSFGFQEAIVDTATYIGNSVFRDTIYIGSCK